MPYLQASSAPREASLDLLKFVMAIFVVGLHGKFLRDIDPTASTLAMQGLFRIAVPCFFVVSGLFFERMDPRRFGPWAWRLLLIYAVWMVAYAGDWVDPSRTSGKEFVRILVFGYLHLWFLPALVLAGLMLHRLRQRPTGELLVLAGTLYLAGLILQYAGGYHLIAEPAVDRWINKLWIYRNFLFFGFPFLTLGFLLSRHQADLALPRRTLFAWGVAALALLLTECLMNRAQVGGTEHFDLLVMLPVLCPILVLWARSFHLSADTRILAQMSTGIYLVHVMVLHQIHAVTDFGDSPVLVLTIAISALLSFLAAKAMRDIPLVARMHHAVFGLTRSGWNVPKIGNVPDMAQDASR